MHTSPALQLLDATVLNTEKYNTGSGYLLGPFLQMGMVQEIIFRLPETGGEVSVSMQEGMAPAYPGQEVELMVLNDAPVGYKPKSGNTYYLFDDIDVRLAFGLNQPLPGLGIWIGALLLVGLSFGILNGNNDSTSTWLSGIILLVPFAYRMFIWLQNRNLKNKLDEMVKQDQWVRV